MALYNPDKEFHYVVGFMFDPLRQNVLLIEKKRPHWQAGKLNGVGGKIEDTDPSPAFSMVREFKEEVGMETQETDWELKLLVEDPRTKNSLYVFTATGAIADAKQIEEEVPFVVPTHGIMEHPQLLPRLKWMLPFLIENKYVGNLIGLVH